MHSPYWWALHTLGLLPIVGTLWWLLLAFAVDKEDEFQLCQFIVALRCTHFATLGVGTALLSCVQAYRCAAFADGPVGCATRLPMLSPFAAVFWLVQLLITLRAFSLLPQSKKKGQRVLVERRSRLSYEHRRALATGGPLPRADLPPDPAAADVASRGGVLPMLGWLDLALALLALAASLLAALVFRADPILVPITLYHVRTAHGLLSIPYVLLRLPGANTLLTHARRTGYDKLGHCVPYVAALPSAGDSTFVTPSPPGTPAGCASPSATPPR